MRRGRWIVPCALALAFAMAGCAHASRPSYGGGGGELRARSASASVYRPSLALEPASMGPGSGGSGAGDDTASDGWIPVESPSSGIEIDVSAESSNPPEAAEPRLAEAVTAAASSDATIASDAVSAPLLVYTGQFEVAVYQVREAQDRIAAAAEELGGFVASRTDTTIVIRVPAPNFFVGVERVSGTGDVLHRDIRTTDVSEEFRDNDIRLRNLEVMRGRLEELLARATDVEDALRVERELERITVELERLRGRQRFLTDRITLATIGVSFRALESEDLDQPEIFNLPFGWLRALGLSTLLRVD